MKCLVTGASGFIGDALVKRLVHEGYSVTGLIHKSKPKQPEKKTRYLQGDITKIGTIRDVVNDVDIIFHCAAVVKDYGSLKKIYSVNFEGTKNLVLACKSIKRFVYLGHIGHESLNQKDNYAKTKALAEKFLIDKYKMEGFPVVIIRPGNVFGPGATTWVLRPLKSIQKNRITLIEKSNGIFHHTYIDNLLDALVTAMEVPGVTGNTIDVTDGDNSVTWRKYLNDLANIAGKKPIKRDISKKSALIISKVMLYLHRISRIEPWVTPTAVYIFTNQKTITIDKAKKLLGYKPRIDYDEGIKRVGKWLRNEHYI